MAQVLQNTQNLVIPHVVVLVAENGNEMYKHL